MVRRLCVEAVIMWKGRYNMISCTFSLICLAPSRVVKLHTIDGARLFATCMSAVSSCSITADLFLSDDLFARGRLTYLFSIDIKLNITFNVDTIVSARLRLTKK